MKKAIGLTANISDFRPNLPQTKHLNYFMGTNPVYMAGGGDVKAGIPNYPDVNVTRGFLPAALGFDDGGEADKDIISKGYDSVWNFIFGYFKSVLGMDDNKAKEETDKVIKDKSQEEIQDIVSQIPIGKSPSFDDIETGKFEGMPPSTLTPKDTAKATEGLPSSHPDFPGKTTTPYDVAKERISKQPELAHWLQDKSIGKFDSVQPNGGITEIKPEKAGMFDINEDGVVDMKDLVIIFDDVQLVKSKNCVTKKRKLKASKQKELFQKLIKQLI